MMRRRWVLPAAVVMVFAMAGVALAGTGPAHKDIPREFSGEAALAHIQALATGPRVGGTPAELQAAEYIKSYLAGLGYEASLQQFPIWYFEGRGCSLEVLSPAAVAGPRAVNLLTYSAPGDVETDLVYCGLGKAEDFAGLDVTGKIALIKRGSITFLEKTQNAMNHGASAVVIFNSAPANFFGTLQKPVGMPAVSISGVDGEALVAALAEGPVKVHLVSDTTIEQRYSHNVIASKKPSRGKGTGKVVLVGAHLDSVAAGPGTNDNASGVAVMLEAARVLKDYDLASEVRFLAFGSEELSLVGSNYYAASLTPEEVSSIIGMINLDMVGVGGTCSSGNIGISDEWLVDLGIATAGEMGLTMEKEARGTNSDHYPFEALGIPVNFVTWGPDPYYHTPQDTVDKISTADLNWAGDVVTANMFDLAKTPLPKSVSGILAKAHKYTSTYMGRECDLE
ncbi:MAG: M20/M25/M40 family metallo-hydrolase [Firmicutes bacterium]|nr:M20/M25/M40 family metallo-hydrolase [Bacillota bacterium]